MKNKTSGEKMGLAALAAAALLVGTSPAWARMRVSHSQAYRPNSITFVQAGLLSPWKADLGLGKVLNLDIHVADRLSHVEMPRLGRASGFAVLSAAPDAGGAATFTGSTIGGDVGSSGLPAAVVPTGSQIAGAIVAPVDWQIAADFNGAYDALAATSCDRKLPAALADITLEPGVYCFDAAATLTGVLTLKGSSNEVWLFKTGTGVTGVSSSTGALTGANLSVVLAGGAQACNVYWQVAKASTMTNSDFKGNILAGTGITFTGGTFNGRALAKGAVTMTGVAASGCGGGNM